MCRNAWCGVALNQIAQKSLTEKVIFDLRVKGCKGARHPRTQGMCIAGCETSILSGPQTEKCLWFFVEVKVSQCGRSLVSQNVDQQFFSINGQTVNHLDFIG